MKQNLQLRTSHKLALTPQLQQSIRLLQLSTVELQQEIEQHLLSNPLLECLNDPLDSAIRLTPDGAFSFSTPQVKNDLSSEDNSPNGDDDALVWNDVNVNHATHSDDGDDGDTYQPHMAAVEPSLREYLLDQANVTARTERDAALLRLLIEAIDDNGYLEESLDQIYERLPKEFNIERDDLVFALNLLQSFDPVGVGARDIQECLSLQIERMNAVAPDVRRLSLDIVKRCLPDLARHHFTGIKKLTGCDENQLQKAQQLIHQCQPHPGQRFSKSRIDFITPDVMVTKIGHDWHVQLNPQVIPQLQINALYANVLRHHKDATSLQGQLQEARWLIKNIHQRFETLLRVSSEIARRQHHYFSHGAIAMRPLVLREIADKLKLHESTVSRVTTQKYMLTPHGIVELKYFFANRVATDAGGEASSTAIRALIKQLIGAENQHTPLSDSKIAALLSEHGMTVARRTVAKYREALNILPVNLRKIL